MNKSVLRATCIVALYSASALAQQTIPVPTAGPGTSPYDTRATVDSNQSSYSVRNVPQLSAPSLTTTLSDTCMGSTSFGVSVTGFGATAGTTRVDEACVRRLDAREFRAMGLSDVALSLLCQSDANRRAVEATGHLCPGTTSPLAKVSATAQTAQLTDDEKYRDPFVRARLGLPALNPTDGNGASGSSPKESVKPELKPLPPEVAQISPSVKPVQVQLADLKQVAQTPAQSRGAGTNSHVVDNADAMEQKIKKFGWLPASKQAAQPFGSDGGSATVVK